MQPRDLIVPETKVLAVMRKAVPEGQDPRTGELIEVQNLGPNVLTLKGRHVLMANMAPANGETGQLPAANRYGHTNNWYLKYMSVGTGTDAADTADDYTDFTEVYGTRKEFTSESVGDVDESDNSIIPFSEIEETDDATYTHIAWRCMYNSGEADGVAISEVGLWFADATSSPEGDITINDDVRGPLAARKVLPTVINKSTSFSLEFIWVWMG